MTTKFDPYHKWLGISPKDQPPHHYRLLGIELFESDPEVVDAASNRLMAYLQDLSSGDDNVEAAQQLLNEIAMARVCLMDDGKREKYNQRLRKTLKSARGPEPPKPSNKPTAAPPKSPLTPVPPKKQDPVIQVNDRSASSSGSISRPQHANRPHTRKRKSSQEQMLYLGGLVLLMVVLGIVVAPHLTSALDTPPPSPKEGDQIASAGNTPKTPAPKAPAKPSVPSKPVTEDDNSETPRGTLLDGKPPWTEPPVVEPVPAPVPEDLEKHWADAQKALQEKRLGAVIKSLGKYVRSTEVEHFTEARQLLLQAMAANVPDQQAQQLLRSLNAPQWQAAKQDVSFIRPRGVNNPLLLAAFHDRLRKNIPTVEAMRTGKPIPPPAPKPPVVVDKPEPEPTEPEPSDPWSYWRPRDWFVRPVCGFWQRMKPN